MGDRNHCCKHSFSLRDALCALSKVSTDHRSSRRLWSTACVGACGVGFVWYCHSGGVAYGTRGWSCEFCVILPVWLRARIRVKSCVRELLLARVESSFVTIKIGLLAFVRSLWKSSLGNPALSRSCLRLKNTVVVLGRHIGCAPPAAVESWHSKV